MDRIPSITQQVRADFIRHSWAKGRAYNSGMIRLGESTILTTRHFNPTKGRCEIVLCVLNGRDSKRIKVMNLPAPLGHEQFEDARLFMHGDKVMMAYTEGHYTRQPYVSVQKLVQLDEELDVERVIDIRYGRNFDKSEKNWQFFSKDGRLFFVYRISPHVVVEIDDDGNVVNEWKGKQQIHWPEGEMRGGTPPMAMSDAFISFFHSHVPHPERIRRYNFGAYSFALEPPFDIVGITEPIARASGNDPEQPNPSVPHWMPYVVFPVGHVLLDGTHLVTVGINDSYDALVRIKDSELEFKGVAAFTTPRARYFKTTNATRPIRTGVGRYLEWQHTKGPRSILLGNLPGVVEVTDPATVELVASRPGVTEIHKDEYLRLLG
jgi:predicted GH43/DUF377 family glycosyl hydrolase